MRRARRVDRHRARVSPRLPLPDACLTAPWRTRDLPELDRRTRTRDDVVRPFRGVRRHVDLDPDDPAVRALTAVAAWPGTPLGGWAAAHLLGVADTDGRSSSGALLPVPLCPGRSGRIARRDGIVLLRSPLEEDDVVEVGGVLVTAPLRTAFDLARTALHLRRAVEEVDCVFRGRDPAFPVLLAGYAADRPRWKGVQQARRAAALTTVRTRSRGESWLRMVWTQLAGLPEPRVNVPVHDAEDERDSVVATPDLLDEASGLAGEYDGRPHCSAAHQHADAVRGELMAGVGLTLVRATALDRASPALMVRRLLAAHRVALRVQRRTWWVAPAQDAGSGASER